MFTVQSSSQEPKNLNLQLLTKPGPRPVCLYKRYSHQPRNLKFKEKNVLYTLELKFKIEEKKFNFQLKYKIKERRCHLELKFKIEEKMSLLSCL